MQFTDTAVKLHSSNVIIIYLMFLVKTDNVSFEIEFKYL
jgi:hypothetical protein